MKISWWLWRQSHLSVGAMYHHSLLPVAIRNSPSHTTSPPTYAFPSIFAIPNRFCSFTSVILMTNVSPAITGFRNLTLSIPAKKKFSREPPTSGCNITRPPTWAIACDQQQIHNRWTRDIDNLVYEPWPRNVTILVIKLAQLGTLIYKIVDLVIKFQKTLVFFFFDTVCFAPIRNSERSCQQKVYCFVWITQWGKDKHNQVSWCLPVPSSQDGGVLKHFWPKSFPWAATCNTTWKLRPQMVLFISALVDDFLSRAVVSRKFKYPCSQSSSIHGKCN